MHVGGYRGGRKERGNERVKGKNKQKGKEREKKKNTIYNHIQSRAKGIRSEGKKEKKELL